MAANPNIKALQTVTVGVSGASNITFSSIPQTYTDLKIVVSARTNRSGFSYDNINIYPNGSSSSLSGRYILGYGSGYTSATDTSGIGAAGADGDSATASVFSNVEIYIPNYTGTSNKSFSTDAVLENNGTDGRQGMTASLWSSSSAITSLQIVPSSGPNFVQFTTATLYGITSAAISAKATGGIITQDANYFYHTFVSSGIFAPTQTISADYLVVAGGGGAGQTAGGGWNGGCGGAGGYRLLTSQSLTAQNYTVTVGAGGAGGAYTAGGGNQGANGGTSSISSTSSSGGGGGGTTGTNGKVKTSGKSGGSGGGSAQDTTSNTGGSGNAGGYTPVEGYAGGNVNGSTPYVPAQGGGSSGVGSQVNARATNGTTSSISGYSVTYATGGSYGGFGNANAASNTGNGGNSNTTGSSGNNDAPGWNGGSGIVIVRYAK